MHSNPWNSLDIIGITVISIGITHVKIDWISVESPILVTARKILLVYVNINFQRKPMTIAY